VQHPTQPDYPGQLPGGLFYLPGIPTQELSPGYGGGGAPEADYTWHLSIIDAGQPRQEGQTGPMIADVEESYFSAVSWNGSELRDSQFILADSDGKPAATFTFGTPGATPVTGDWNGDGTTKVGVFYEGFWFLDLNGDGRWSKEDLWARLGQAGDRPITGDWDGDGKTDIGIFGPAWAGDHRAIRNEPGLPDVNNRIAANSKARYKNIPPDPEQATSGWRTLKRTAFGKFRKDLIDHVFLYGDEKHIPVTGDWNGDGVTNIGIFCNGTWFLDVDGDGRWSAGDVEITLGQAGDIPLVGDWNGDGRAKLGVYRNGEWLLDTNGDGVLDAHDRAFQLGEPGDVPVVGDWNGDGIDEIGVYRAGTPAPAKQASAQSAPSAAPQSAEPVIKR
jgi:serine-aspartate repeat-containing protein C/D/E